MKSFVFTVAGLALVPAASPAQSAVYADDLGKCLVAKSSDADKIDLVKWVFASMAAHPAVASMANVSAPQRETIDATMGELFNRLLTMDCRPQSVTALKYEGPAALQSGFGLLGKVAMGELMSNAAVDKAMEGFVGKIDNNAIHAVMKEAGLKVPEKAPK